MCVAPEFRSILSPTFPSHSRHSIPYLHCMQAAGDKWSRLRGMQDATKISGENTESIECVWGERERRGSPPAYSSRGIPAVHFEHRCIERTPSDTSTMVNGRQELHDELMWQTFSFDSSMRDDGLDFWLVELVEPFASRLALHVFRWTWPKRKIRLWEGNRVAQTLVLK